MDPTDCPQGFATDIVFRVYPGVKCDTDLAIYWGVTMTITVLKFFHVILHHSDWRKKHRKGNKPVGTAVFTFSVVIHFVQYVLYGLNIANCLNGWSLSLYSICFLPDAWQITILLKRCVNLGASVTRAKVTMLSEAQIKRLKSFGRIGRSLFISQLLCLLVSSIVLVIGSPIDPESDTALVGKIGFAFKCSFLSLAVLGIIYQIQRVISMFQSVSTVDSKSDNLIKARQKLLLMQVLVATLFCVPLVYFLLVIDSIHWTWWAIVAIPQGIEATVNFLGGLPILLCCKVRKDHSTQPNEGMLSIVPESEEIGKDVQSSQKTVSDFKSKKRARRQQRMSKMFKLRIPGAKPFSLMSRVTEEPTQTTAGVSQVPKSTVVV